MKPVVENPVFVHPAAIVDISAKLGEGVKIWAWSQVRENASIGDGTSVGSRVLIEQGVQIGKNVKIQNGASIFSGVQIEDGVFIGPSVSFTNDKFPRAIHPDGSKKHSLDWALGNTRISYGASIGAGAILICGITVGRWAMIGAGTVVTTSVPDFALVYGNPGVLQGYVCKCGHTYKIKTDIFGCRVCTISENELRIGSPVVESVF